MNNKKVKKALKVYNVIGKSLCACAGGIVGFIVAGPFGAIPGALIGGLSGHFIGKGAVQLPKKIRKSSV
jgi:hypothetical protein